jgi:hypothetical protein
MKVGVWFRRGRLFMVSPDSLGTACPLSGRNSTYRLVQISETSSLGAERPKAWRQRAPKQCFRNASNLAFDKKCLYVEGFALARVDGLMIHHAWVTIDGVHALDPTWADATVCAYFGIAFRAELVGRALNSCRQYGLLDPLDTTLLESPVGQ